MPWLVGRSTNVRPRLRGVEGYFFLSSPLPKTQSPHWASKFSTIWITLVPTRQSCPQLLKPIISLHFSLLGSPYCYSLVTPCLTWPLKSSSTYMTTVPLWKKGRKKAKAKWPMDISSDSRVPTVQLPPPQFTTGKTSNCTRGVSWLCVQSMYARTVSWKEK